MTTSLARQIALVVRKVRFGDAKSDAAEWRRLSYQERIEALEQVREEYQRWKADARLKKKLARNGADARPCRY